MKAIQIEFKLFLLSFSIYSQNEQINTSQNFENEIEFSIYPNPAKDIVYIKSNQKVEYIKLYNKQGKPVLKSYLKDNKINLSRLDDGYYLFCAYINGKRIKKGIIKKT